MLNLFPNPSPLGLALDPTGNRGYNFRYPQQQLRPLDDKILRVDYNISPKVQSSTLACCRTTRRRTATT